MTYFNQKAREMKLQDSLWFCTVGLLHLICERKLSSISVVSTITRNCHVLHPDLQGASLLSLPTMAQPAQIASSRNTHHQIK